MQPTQLTVLCALSLDGRAGPNFPWQTPSTRAPALSLAEARRSLSERKIVSLNSLNYKESDVLAVLGSLGTVLLSAAAFVLPSVLAPLGPPLPVTLPPCDDNGPTCNAGYNIDPDLYMSMNFAWSFFGYALLAYALLRTPDIYRGAKLFFERCQFAVQTIENTHFNAQIDQLLTLLPSKHCHEQGVPSALVASIIDYLAESSLAKLSFAQLDAYREKNPAGFKRLLSETCLLNIEQRSYWHLLAHIEKVKDNPQEQQRILTFSGNLELLRQEPLLFEKILRIVQATLSRKPQVVFFQDILKTHLLTKKAVQALGQRRLLRKIIEDAAYGRMRLEEAILSTLSKNSSPLMEHAFGRHTLPPHISRHCTEWLEQASPHLLAQLEGDEFKPFIDLLTSFSAEAKDYYPLLKITTALNLKGLSAYFDAALAKCIDTWMPSNDLYVVLPAIAQYACPLVQQAVNAYFSKGENLACFALPLLTPPLDQLPYLASAHQASRSYIEMQIAALAAIADPKSFSALLLSYPHILFQKEMQAVLLQWLSDFPSQGEALWQLAATTPCTAPCTTPWLPNEILYCLKQKPILLSYWNSPPLL